MSAIGPKRGPKQPVICRLRRKGDNLTVYDGRKILPATESAVRCLNEMAGAKKRTRL
jgi:hypothetical protein